MDALVTIAAAALTPVSVAKDLVVVGRQQTGRLVGGAGDLVEEVVVTVRAARIVLLRVADALEEGPIDDLGAGLEDVSRAAALVERVSGQVDRALPVLDSATPTLALMNSTLAQLELTLAQLQSMPDVRMTKRLAGRPADADPRSSSRCRPGPALLTDQGGR